VNVGAKQADFAVDGHVPATLEVLANLDVLCLQRHAAGVGEVGVGEAELRADVGAHQVDLSLGGKAPTAVHAPSTVSPWANRAGPSEFFRWAPTKLRSRRRGRRTDSPDPGR
jgi:hypothetical protein